MGGVCLFVAWYAGYPYPGKSFDEVREFMESWK